MCRLDFINDLLNRRWISIDYEYSGSLISEKMRRSSAHSAARPRDHDPCARDAPRQCAQSHKSPLIRLETLKPMLSQEMNKIGPLLPTFAHHSL
jgi:hypothetical protein